MIVGLLHPGEMGAALGICLGTRVAWASDGRSDATRSRASDAGFLDEQTIAALVDVSSIIISVCPPAAARDVGREVSEFDFSGIYVDANAIAPGTSREIGSYFDRYVDASIVGPPPHEQGDTRLYLSGDEADVVAQMFAGSNAEPKVLGEEIGRASALKMAYAGWTKGSSALLLAINAFAAEEGVEADLIEEWDLSVPGTRERVEGIADRIGAKAWRYGGEMDEIAASMVAAGLPDGFHRAAGQIYRALADLKGHTGHSVVEVLDRILGDGGS